MKEWQFVALALIIVVGVPMLIISVAVQDAQRDDACINAGYADCLSYAGHPWCVKVEDGSLIGVPLESVTQ